jgi:membrane protease YdiL (CAAX protease family)
VESPELVNENATPSSINEDRPRPTEPSPNNPPWGSGVAIGVWLFSVFLILILPSIFLVIYSVTLNPPIRETAALIEFAKNDKTAILVQILAVVPAHVLTLALAWLVITQNRTYSFRQTLGWRSGGVRWWHHVFIIFGFFLIAAVVSLYFPEQDNDLLRIIQSSRTVAVLVAILATFTAPIVEEVVYRGILYSAFQRSLNVPAAFLLVTLLFAIVHVPQYYPSYSTIFLLALLSVTLTALRVRSRNLLPCIILHMLFNGLQSLRIVFEQAPENSDPTGLITWLLK